MEATHRQTCYGTVLTICQSAITGIHKLHYLRERYLERALHGLRQSQCRNYQIIRSLSWSCLLRDIAIGHDDDHWLRLALRNEVIEDLRSTSQIHPRFLVATDAMQEIKHRIFLLAGLITCRGIYCHTTSKASFGIIIPDL